MTAPDPTDQLPRASGLLALAEHSADKRQWNAADSQFRDAISLDPTPASRIAYGIRLAQQERYFEAISIFTPVLDSDDRFAIGIVCHNLAAIYRDVGDLDLARRFQWRATLLQDDLGNAEVLGMTNDALASGRAAVAESLIMTACVLTEDDAEQTSDADLMATTGLVKAALNSTQEGLITLYAAYCRHRTANDLRGMGADLLNMATLFGTVDRHRAERACLVRAIRCFQQAPAPVSCQKAEGQLARFDRQQDLRSFDVRRN